TIGTLTARRTTRTTLFIARSGCLGRHFAVGQHVALVDPNLDTDDAVGRLGFGSAVVDVGAQRVQGHTAFAVPLGTGNFDTVQTAGAHDLDALSTETHCVLHGALHGAAEHDALLELLSDRISDELGVGFRLADFLDVDVHRHAHQALQIGLQVLDVLAALADHHTRTSRVDGDACVLGGTLDDHAADRCVLQLLLEVFANTNVLAQHATESLVVRVPARTPVTVDREAEANRVDFLSHCDSLSPDLDHDVAGLLLDTVTAALGTGGKTSPRLALVDVDSRDTELVDVGAVVVLGVGDGGLKSLLEDIRRLLRRECQDVQGLGDALAADQIRNKPRFLSRDADTTDSCSSFHTYLRAFLSAAWPLNVRVSANSPSL